MRRTRSVLAHFAQTVGLDVLLVLGIVLMVGRCQSLALDGWDCSQILLHPRLYRKTASPAHQTTTITPRFDQQQPNFATEPSQYPAATGSPNIYPACKESRRFDPGPLNLRLALQRAYPVNAQGHYRW